MKERRGLGHRTAIMLYDLFLLLAVDTVLLVLYRTNFAYLTPVGVLAQFLLSILTVFSFRLALGVYRQVWHYADAPAYMKLILSDLAALISHYFLQFLLPLNHMSLMRVMSMFAGNLLLCMSSRLVYQYLYKTKSKGSKLSNLLRKIVYSITGIRILPSEAGEGTISQKINIAIVGAGRIGAALAEELVSNPKSTYIPVCFIDNSKEKIGRYINGIRVLGEQDVTPETLAEFPVQEIVFALPDMDGEKTQKLYEQYKSFGCRLKVYDYPMAHTEENGKRSMREFAIEELLFRRPQDFLDETTREYYKDKTILITGGGGSIGSELCRQIARMHPKKLIILDVYENGAYDIQQELKILYKDTLDVAVEILSVCDKEALNRTFQEYKPQIVLHAAAHKHVPLMEHNCAEAVRNNVFGTLNTVEAAEEAGVEKFIMISTDKAVNPTNVMGATKRMCEQIVQSHTGGKTKFSATRFGNVLGSNGSVIPLFKRQIEAGGPVTITDKRIIRYFMTIQEATQLVLTSGAMAKDGELFVLDMGQPVKILDLAESMIRLTGYEPYKDIDIVETGLRPGEKLYEELLVQGEDLGKTDNKKIFTEKDTALTKEELQSKLEKLKRATKTGDDETVRQALRECVPTFRDPDEVNEASKTTENH